jgi:hypothetical protein
MLCGQSYCGCAFQSSSLVISGSGQIGDPLHLETAGPGIVELEGDVSSPFLGQTIYETTTQRLKVYDGSDWVIYGGDWPRASVKVGLTGTQDIATGVTTEIEHTTTLFDTDSFYSGTGGNFFIQTGLSGDYMVAAFNRFNASANSGVRSLQITTTGNTFTNEIASISVGAEGVNSSNQGPSYSRLMRLSEGTTIVHNAYQTTGVTLDVIQAGFTIHMVRHIPGL